MTDIAVPPGTEKFATVRRLGRTAETPAKKDDELLPPLITATAFAWRHPATIPRRRCWAPTMSASLFPRRVAPRQARQVEASPSWKRSQSQPDARFSASARRSDETHLEWRRSPNRGIAAAHQTGLRSAIDDQTESRRPPFRRYRARNQDHHRRADEDRRHHRAPFARRRRRADEIGLMIVDPFVASHRVVENDNPAIELVAATLGGNRRRDGMSTRSCRRPQDGGRRNHSRRWPRWLRLLLAKVPEIGTNAQRNDRRRSHSARRIPARLFSRAEWQGEPIAASGTARMVSPPVRRPRQWRPIRAIVSASWPDGTGQISLTA